MACLKMIPRASRLKTYLHDDPAGDIAEDIDENANAGDDASSLLSCASSSRPKNSSNCLLKLFHFCSNSSTSRQKQSISARLDADCRNSIVFLEKMPCANFPGGLVLEANHCKKSIVLRYKDKGILLNGIKISAIGLFTANYL